MDNAKGLKQIVKDKYASLASSEKAESCCSSSSEELIHLFSEDYKELDGYVADADLGLGCGLPTEHAGLEEGQVVVDLGSGAGNDAFIARQLVGATGRVIGIDMTEEMNIKARENTAKLGYDNVEFVFGDIEDVPLEDQIADVVISNCVLNLVPDKVKAYSEIRRILKPTGHFCISDVVTEGEFPGDLRSQAELYVGCVAGAMQKGDYLSLIQETGFSSVRVAKESVIELPGEIASKVGDAKILSVTLVGS